MGRLIDEYEDIKTQQECVSKTIDTLWKRAQKYQQLQADYENRLKADMVAMLTEIKKEIHEISTTPNTSKGFKLGQATAYYKCEFLIEQKINKLREGEL